MSFVKSFRRVTKSGVQIVKSFNRSPGAARRLLHGKMGSLAVKTPLSQKRIRDAKIRLTEPGLSRRQKRTINSNIKSLRKTGVVSGVARRPVGRDAKHIPTSYHDDGSPMFGLGNKPGGPSRRKGPAMRIKYGSR